MPEQELRDAVLPFRVVHFQCHRLSSESTDPLLMDTPKASSVRQCPAGRLQIALRQASLLHQVGLESLLEIFIPMNGDRNGGRVAWLGVDEVAAFGGALEDPSVFLEDLAKVLAGYGLHTSISSRAGASRAAISSRTASHPSRASRMFAFSSSRVSP